MWITYMEYFMKFTFGAIFAVVMIAVGYRGGQVKTEHRHIGKVSSAYHRGWMDGITNCFHASYEESLTNAFVNGYTNGLEFCEKVVQSNIIHSLSGSKFHGTPAP